MADVLLLALIGVGLALLVTAGFLVSVVAGLIITGVGLIALGLFLGLAFADGQGFQWRRS